MHKIEIHRKMKAKKLQPLEMADGTFYQVVAIDRPPHTSVRVGDTVIVLVDKFSHKTLYNATWNVVITPNLGMEDFAENEFLVEETTEIDCIKIMAGAIPF